jgi:large subunit ribosomal protein L21
LPERGQWSILERWCTLFRVSFRTIIDISNKAGFIVVYAVVRAGGRQEKVEVGSIITVDRISADAKNSVTLAPVLYVDGASVTHDKKELDKITVTAEVLQDLRGPKIVIQKYKNKTGYKKRQGFRSELTKLKITGITKK